MKGVIFFSGIALFFSLLPGVSRGALNFTAIGDTVIPIQGDLNAGVTIVTPPVTLNSGADGSLTFADGFGAVGPNPSSAFSDVTIQNNSLAGIGTWKIAFNWTDFSNSVPFTHPVNLAISMGSSSATVSGADGFRTVTLVNSIGPSLSDTLRFSFSSSGSSALLDFAASLTGITVTAMVPEPSSALFLTGILGAFGGFFRRRRSLPLP